MILEKPDRVITAPNRILLYRVTLHYNDVIMSAMASQTTSLTIVYSTVYSGVDQRKHQSSASLAFVRGIHRWPVNSPHKGPVSRKMFPFDDVIMIMIRLGSIFFVYGASIDPRFTYGGKLYHSSCLSTSPCDHTHKRVLITHKNFNHQISMEHITKSTCASIHTFTSSRNQHRVEFGRKLPNDSFGINHPHPFSGTRFQLIPASITINS